MKMLGVGLAPMPLMISWTVPGHCTGCEVGFHPFKNRSVWEGCYFQAARERHAYGDITRCPPRKFGQAEVAWWESIAHK